MASILLASAGAAIGGSIGGAVLGVSAATIGGAIGSFAGSMVDSWIVSSLAPGQRIEGQRLDNLQIPAHSRPWRCHARLRCSVEKSDFRTFWIKMDACQTKN